MRPSIFYKCPHNQTFTTNKLFLFLGWELRGLSCYKYFSIKHSWEKAAELCRRYDILLLNIFFGGITISNLIAYII